MEFKLEDDLDDVMMIINSESLKMRSHHHHDHDFRSLEEELVEG